MRFSGMNQGEIGEALGVSASTICRDLEAVHEEIGTQLQARETMLREVTEATALYGMLEAAAFRELVRLEADDEATTGAKIKAIAAVHAMRRARLDLLASVGVLRGGLPEPSGISSAVELRARLKALGILDEIASRRDLLDANVNERA
jgi:hypothetical protein